MASERIVHRETVEQTVEPGSTAGPDRIVEERTVTTETPVAVQPVAPVAVQPVVVQPVVVEPAKPAVTNVNVTAPGPTINPDGTVTTAGGGVSISTPEGTQVNINP